MSEPRHRETLPRSTRIRSRRVFDQLFETRICARDRWITVFAGRNDLGLARLGIAVGRRFGSAVRRNRVKRLIREAFRRVRHDLPQGIDWIVRPHPGVEPGVHELTDSLRQLSERLARKVPPDK